MKLEIEIDGRMHRVDMAPDGQSGQWNVRLDDQAIQANAQFIRPGVLSLIIEGRSHRVVLDADLSDSVLHIGEYRIPWQAEDPRSFRRRRRHGGAEGPVTLKASMPGRVVRVLVQKGDTVAAHQGIIVVEAMKMQNELQSPKEGRVADLRVAAGDTVKAGQVLAVIE